MNSQPIAKSLHTVTVLINVARDFSVRHGIPIEDGLHEAMNVLGLAGRPDPYGLEAKALRLAGGEPRVFAVWKAAAADLRANGFKLGQDAELYDLFRHPDGRVARIEHRGADVVIERHASEEAYEAAARS